jgi:small GTP-binding protein
MRNYDNVYKIIIVGNNCTGKTTLCHNYINNTVMANVESTIGIDFHSNILEIGDRKIKIILWDTAGQEAFRSLIRSYYQNTCGVIIVYDITNRKSFEDVKYWIDEFQAYNSCKNEIHTHNPMIIGNKTDLANGKYTKCKISYDEGYSFAKKNNCFFFELKKNDFVEIKRAFDTYIEYLVDNFTEKSCGCALVIKDLYEKPPTVKIDNSCFTSFRNFHLMPFCSIL